MFKVAVLVALAVFAGSSSASSVRPTTAGIQVQGEADNNRYHHGLNDSIHENVDAKSKKVELESASWSKKVTVTDPASSGWKYLLHLIENEHEHLLKIDADATAQRAPANVSAVPLPTAFWLFGSALFGFVTLSNRRKV